VPPWPSGKVFTSLNGVRTIVPLNLGKVEIPGSIPGGGSIFTMIELPEKLRDELKTVINIIREAGEVLLSYQDTNNVKKKEDGTYVTEADHAVSSFIHKNLASRFPEYGYVDEELTPSEEELQKEFCWVIDPLDSTRDFVEGRDGFSIIIGLLHKGKPVLGVAYQPQQEVLYYAVKGEGAYVVRFGKTLKLQVSQDKTLRLVITRSRKTAAETTWLREVLHPVSLVRKGGSLKIVDVATGMATLFLILPVGVMSVWDLCGTTIILEEAGGTITDFTGESLNFLTLKHTKGILASNSIGHEMLVQKLQDAERNHKEN
jgi:3'(2'), 5'-bisphosphate nucleotidase